MEKEMKEFNEFKMEEVIKELNIKRKFFTSEADFQLEMAWTIEEMYKCKVRMEYCYDDLQKGEHLYIDILVVNNEKNSEKNSWIPIELKYKTKKCIVQDEIGKYVLKEQGAQDQGRYKYLKDIQRIETIRRKENSKFVKGYTVFLTNDSSYESGPQKEDTVDKSFSLKNGRIINEDGKKLDWKFGTKAGTKKGCESFITLEDKYNIKWDDYSTVESQKNGKIEEIKFKYLINEIKK